MKLFEYVEDIEDLKPKPEASSKCTMCGDCERYARDVLNVPRAFEIRADESEFEFSYETNGTYSPKNLLLKTIDVLTRRVAYNEQKFWEAVCEKRASKRVRLTCLQEQ